MIDRAGRARAAGGCRRGPSRPAARLDLGARVFDTAWYYGLDIASQLLAEATRSFPEALVIATKLGVDHP